MTPPSKSRVKRHQSQSAILLVAETAMRPAVVPIGWTSLTMASHPLWLYRVLIQQRGCGIIRDALRVYFLWYPHLSLYSLHDIGIARQPERLEPAWIFPEVPLLSHVPRPVPLLVGLWTQVWKMVMSAVCPVLIVSTLLNQFIRIYKGVITQSITQHNVRPTMTAVWYVNPHTPSFVETRTASQYTISVTRERHWDPHHA